MHTRFDLEIKHLFYSTDDDEDSAAVALLLKITDAGFEHVAPQKLSTGQTLEFDDEQKSHRLYFLRLVLRVFSRVSHEGDESLSLCIL